MLTKRSVYRLPQQNVSRIKKKESNSKTVGLFSGVEMAIFCQFQNDYNNGVFTHAKFG